MDKANLNVKVESANGTVTLVTGQRELLKEKSKQAIKLSGVLQAPADFLAGRATKYNDLETHLEIYKSEGKLALIIHEDVHTTHQVTGQLSIDSNLASFKINEEKTWTVQELKKFILARGFFFENPAEATQLINNLNSFTAKVNVLIKEHNSNDGNSLLQLETKVNGIEMKKDFTLNIPIYQGYEKKKFKVNIGFEPTSTAVLLFLYSEDLALLVHSERERIVDNELKKFDDKKFSKVLLS